MLHAIERECRVEKTKLGATFRVARVFLPLKGLFFQSKRRDSEEPRLSKLKR